MSPMKSPLGIGAIILFAGALILFIWNLRREEVTHEQWAEIVKQRQEPLDKLQRNLERFKDRTNELAKEQYLNDLETYGLGGKSALELYAKGLFAYNKPYTDLCANTQKLLKSDIEMLVSKLDDKELRKVVHSLYRREGVAHSFCIFNSLYKAHYDPDPRIEKRIDQSTSVPLFEQAFRRVYKRIDELKRGKDIG